MAHSPSEKIKVIRSFSQFDVVYLQKKLITPLEVIFFKKYAKKLVFDFDDAIYYRDDMHDLLESKTRYFKFRHLVRNVDLVVAGNRILSDYASQFNKHVVVMPSAVETRNIPLKDHNSLNDKIIIGWIGSKGNLHHLKMLSSVFRRLSQIYEIQINIVSNGSIEIPGVEVKHIPWRLESQENEIALFDIGVMPLPKNRWTEGKCGYKALQYMAASVPPVCSDVGINREIVEDGKEGFIVFSQDEFYKALVTLIDNRNLREEMGFNAREKVEKQFSVSVVAKKLVNILKHCSVW
jgi:glycosyltransferase involved in cell wall biosynthesis